MSKKVSVFVMLFLFIGLSSFGIHKFYVSIYQIDFVPNKNRIEITARIFMDDLNLALEKEFNTKVHIGEKSQTTQDIMLLQKYLNTHLLFSIDGTEHKALFLSTEIDNNVVVVYLKIKEIKKFKSIKIFNNALLDLYPDQQNIIQTNFYNNKKNYIFTGDYFLENINIK